mmetsp:Transcript_89667/g.159277  ORF Transcript_89667/g.159277 Transcript_89667/m.159277 type:complete len:209 (+) Transcript_89667:760-1386(+)
MTVSPSISSLFPAVNVAVASTGLQEARICRTGSRGRTGAPGCMWRGDTPILASGNLLDNLLLLFCIVFFQLPWRESLHPDLVQDEVLNIQLLALIRVVEAFPWISCVSALTALQIESALEREFQLLLWRRWLLPGFAHDLALSQLVQIPSAALKVLLSDDNLLALLPRHRRPPSSSGRDRLDPGGAHQVWLMLPVAVALGSCRHLANH